MQYHCASVEEAIRKMFELSQKRIPYTVFWNGYEPQNYFQNVRK